MKKLTKIEAMQRIAAEDMKTLRERGELIVCVTVHQGRNDNTLRIERYNGMAAEQGRGPGYDRTGAILSSYCRSLDPSIEAICPDWSGLSHLKAALSAAGWNLELLADQPDVSVFRLSRSA